MAESRNGMRQPQSVNAASPMDSRQMRMTSSAATMPIVAVVWIQLVYNPLLPSGAGSAM